MNSLFNKVINALRLAEQHNSNLMVKPEVILWPDPEEQWKEVIPVLQEYLSQLLVLGSYDPDKKQGPAIWLKTMVAKMLPEADWPDKAIPIIYLPGISKNDFRNVERAVFALQPLIEYQYTGTFFVQENGREWTILAFVENPVYGLGVKVTKDNATKEALRKTLPAIFQDKEVFDGKSFIDADFLNNQMFPDIMPTILKWMCKGDDYLAKMPGEKKEVFINICKSQYGFEPDYKNIKAIAEKLGAQKNEWKYIWQMYKSAPKRYPEIRELLHLAKPADLGTGLFALPRESWPQVNEEEEKSLRNNLKKAVKRQPGEALKLLYELEKQHGKRRSWVWGGLNETPLAEALKFLLLMASESIKPFPSSSIEDLKQYYIVKGVLIDQSMRKSLAAVKQEKDVEPIISFIQLFYKPWLENITKKFQQLIEKDPFIFSSQKAEPEKETFVLFVDALRYELAVEFVEKLKKKDYNVSLEAGWSAIPSLTPTAKPAVSPIAVDISEESEFRDFRPQLKKGKDLLTNVFRDTLKEKGFTFVANTKDINPNNKSWQEIGDIDTKGHEEQSKIVKRTEELFDQVFETIEVVFNRGVKRIKIVTDHGWLLLPGGLPKTSLYAGLAETRWGRCALIKESVKSKLLHLPWRWNPSIYIAYAPGISFFKVNQEYAHGGISLHECLVPTLLIENKENKEIYAEIKIVKWINLKCEIYTTEVPENYSVDIRTKYSDSKTSVVLSKNRNLKENKISLMVDDDAEAQATTIVLIDDKERIIDKKPTTVGG